MKSKKEACNWAKAEAKGRYEQRKRQLSVDLMRDNVSHPQYLQLLMQYRAEYEAEIESIEAMFN